MFTPPIGSASEVPSVGSTSAKIAIIGDISSRFDVADMKPISGPAGSIIEECLHASNLIRGEVYITNLVKVNPTKGTADSNQYFREKNGRVKFYEPGLKWVDRLVEELDQCKCNVIVATGPASFKALTDLDYLSRYRGYFFPSRRLKETRKVIGTMQPSKAIRGQYVSRHIIASDLKKARIESHIRELIRPNRRLVWSYSSVDEALQYLDYIADQKVFGFDIEVVNYTVSMISFSARPDVAFVISFADNRWSEEEEMVLWRKIAKILGDPMTEKVLQNGLFDIQFLLSQMGIWVRGKIHDTMIAHHIMYPELRKGLAFLGSIYCGTQEYWKDTVRFDNIKDDS